MQDFKLFTEIIQQHMRSLLWSAMVILQLYVSKGAVTFENQELYKDVHNQELTVQPSCAPGATGVRGGKGIDPMFTSLCYLSLKKLQWFLKKIHLYALWISKVLCITTSCCSARSYLAIFSFADGAAFPHLFLLNWTGKARVLFCSDLVSINPCSSLNTLLFMGQELLANVTLSSLFWSIQWEISGYEKS